jgi:hypothetical protein
MRCYDQACTPWQRVLKSCGKPGEKIQALKATLDIEVINSLEGF